LQLYTGGQSLTNWIPENIIIETDGSLIADAYATYEADVVMYTHAEIQDIYPDVMTTWGGVIQFKDTSLKWLTTKEYVGNWLYDCTPDVDYNINFKEIAVGNRYNSHNYEGNLPITFDVVIPGNFEEERMLNDVKFSRMNMTYRIESIFLKEYHHGTCGDYDIEFIGKTVDHSEIYATTIGGKTRDDKFDEYVAQVAQDMRNTGVGWEQKDIYTESVQTELSDIGCSVGAGGPTRAGVCESATFDSGHYQLRPRVDAKKQRIDYKYGYFAIDIDDSCWRSGPDCTGYVWWPTLVYSPARIEEAILSPGETYERYLMTKVTNQFVHMRFEIKVYFTTTAIIKYELAERILEDPVFDQGNWIMNAEIGGARTYTIVMDQGTSLWDVFSELFGEFGWIINSILIIIVVVVAIYIFIQIGIPVLKGAGTALRAEKKLERR